MRHRLWTLALCGIMVGAGYMVSAADRYPSTMYRSLSQETDRDSGAANAGTTPPSTVPNVKNYYQELFGAPNPRRAAAPTSRTANPSRDATVSQAGYHSDQASAGGVAHPMEASEFENPADPAASSRIVHARYDYLRDKSHDNDIQQIRATEQDIARSPEPSKPNPAIASPPPVTPSENGASLVGPTIVPDRTRSVTGKPATSSKPSAPMLSEGVEVPHLSLQWIKQSEIIVGQECRCDLMVANTSDIKVNEVVVNAYLPSSIRVTNASPAPLESQDHLTWNFASLAPGETKKLEIRMIPSRRGDLPISADVRFSGTASTVFEVEEPMISIAVTGPKDVLVGDPASQIVTIANPGTGIAHNVSIEAQIPKGLEHPRGERLIMDIGSLNPGESRVVRLALAAVQGGQQPVRVTANAESDLSQSAITVVNVIAPSIGVAIEGPALRYMGRNASYVLTVTNDGGIPTNNVIVTHKIPQGFKFVQADHGTQVDNSTNTLRWYVGHLEPDEVAKATVELAPAQLGDFVHYVQAVSEHGVRAVAQIETRIDGTPSLVLDLKDMDDPVEVAAPTAYQIRLRNDGTKSATNVAVECELPDGAELIGIDGPTRPSADGRRLIFSPLTEIQPGKEVIYRVHIRGTSDGNLRFRARLTSDSIEQPLTAEEITKVYRD